MEKPTQNRGPQTKKPEEENRLELDKQSLKELEPDTPAKDAVKGGRATVRNCY